MQKLGTGDLFAKTPQKFKNDENTPTLKIQSPSRILKIQFRQPPYLGIRNLNINFGVILTLSKKVVQFTQTEETEGCE